MTTCKNCGKVRLKEWNRCPYCNTNYFLLAIKEFAEKAIKDDAKCISPEVEK
jgi:uncharacterized OB-fold protein|tara:strand:+ start:40 stop:195 length:156 start_codon:yes stop_codon:yes gene_type:complete